MVTESWVCWLLWSIAAVNKPKEPGWEFIYLGKSSKGLLRLLGFGKATVSAGVEAIWGFCVGLDATSVNSLIIGRLIDF